MSVEPLRMDLSKIAPDAYRHFLQLEGLIGQHVERKLLHLLKLRASQINGCAYCIAMHTDEALRDGEPTERLTLLDAWEESSLYSDKERTALAWIEEVTLIADTGAWGTFSWSELLLSVPALRILGGTEEIMKNILAERVLGLPKEPVTAAAREVRP